jgi:hypothetical protein
METAINILKNQIICLKLLEGLVEWLKWYSTCLARMRLRIQTPVPKKYKN